MEIEEVIREARAGKFRPVHVLVGTERFLIDRAAKLLKAASLGDGPAGFNDDVFHGKGCEARRILSAAKTVPMMARARFVLVRDADELATTELDLVAGYLDDPSPTTCLVLLAEKLDGRTRLAKAAAKAGILAEAKELKGAMLSRFATSEAKDRGHALSYDVAEELVEAVGSDLAALDDALERLSLYVGTGKPIDLAAIEAVVAKVRVETIWALVDAVSSRDAKKAMRAARSLLDDREPPLRVLAMVARQLRMVAKMRDAVARGLRGPDAAKAAGAPPFKANELATAARRFTPPELARAFRVLAETDVALKGSKRPPDVILEAALLDLVRP